MGGKGLMGERCTRCGERERAGKHAWCRGCQREARNAANAKRRDVGKSALVTSAAVASTTKSEPTEMRRVCGNCQVLADDVKRLKRDLAAAHEELETLKGGGADRPEGSPRRDSTSGRVVRMAARPDNDKQYTAHGARCMCQWCQQQRRVAALEGA